MNHYTRRAARWKTIKQQTTSSTSASSGRTFIVRLKHCSRQTAEFLASSDFSVAETSSERSDAYYLWKPR